MRARIIFLCRRKVWKSGRGAQFPTALNWHTFFFVHTIWESFLHLNLTGTTYQGRWDNWYGPSGRSSTYSYDYQKVLKSPAGLSLKAINVPLPNKAKMNSLRKSVDVQCKRPKHASACQPLQQLCLFNILSDPCELNNVRIIFSYFSYTVLFFAHICQQK